MCFHYSLRTLLFTNSNMGSFSPKRIGAVTSCKAGSTVFYPVPGSKMVGKADRETLHVNRAWGLGWRAVFRFFVISLPARSFRWSAMNESLAQANGFLPYYLLSLWFTMLCYIFEQQPASTAHDLFFFSFP